MKSIRKNTLSIFYHAAQTGIGSLLILTSFVGCRYFRAPEAPLPTPLATVQTAEPAATFAYPLDPEKFGPYIPSVSSPLSVDTRFDVQNPGVGNAGKCFVDTSGNQIAFDQLYHAGEDWFALDDKGQIVGDGGKGAEVHAVANGIVTWEQNLGRDGNLIVIEHRQLDGSQIWSAYWHVTDLQATVGEAVLQGQTIGKIHDRGLNSHLHWEIRTFKDGSALFPADSAGGRGKCNGYTAAVGYTWDDLPEHAHPAYWGYLAPGEFIHQHLVSEPTPEH